MIATFGLSFVGALPGVHPGNQGHSSNLTFFLIVGIPIAVLVLIGIAAVLRKR